MKFFVAILCALVAYSSAFSLVQKLGVRLIAVDCQARTGATYEQIQDLNFGRFNATDDKAKCLTKCFLEKLGFMKDGEILEEKLGTAIATLASPEAIKNVQAKCDHLKGANDCETAFLVYACYYNDYGNLPGKTPEEAKAWYYALAEKSALGIYNLTHN